MTNILSLILIVLIFSSCSFNDVGGFWTKEKELKKEELQFKKLFEEEKFVTREFNKDFKFFLEKSSLTLNRNSKIDNNDGFGFFNISLSKIQKYNFSKIKDFYKIEPNLIFHNNNLIFFDNKGSILNFNKDTKLIWKINNYTKAEIKTGPLLSFVKLKDKLIVADNISKIYAIDINNGKILWTIKNNSPSNSQIKVLDDKFFLVDENNTLNCFSINDGKLIWKHNTEKSFINSSKKLSILIKNELLIFSNSLGDITAVDVSNGKLIWQRFTLQSKIYEDIMTLKTSDLVENDNSIYFSNNKNEFYSYDFNTGTTNWIQKINSNLKPTIIGNFLFTVSLDGYFYILEKNTGNILRITNIFKKLRLKKNENIYPTGFILNLKEIFISTSNGKLIIADIKSGNIKDILKIDNELISRPFVHNKNMYLIKNDSIIRLN